MMTILKERLSDILDKTPVLIFLIIVLVVIVLIVLQRITRSKKGRIPDHRIESDFGEKSYRNEILKSLPEVDQLDFSNLYHKLDELQSLVYQGKSQLELQTSETLDIIDRKIQDSQNQINNKWNHQKKKLDFYHCICVHYASFTLADSIKREQENIRGIFVQYKKECDRLAEQIDYLSQQIDSSKGKKKYEYMQQHKANCKKHQRLSKLKNVFASKNTQYLQIVKDQNAYTRQYRKYIIKNFGEKGRMWGKRLEKRKADLIQNV